MLTCEDTRLDYGEQRLQSYGILGERVVFMAWTDRTKLGRLKKATPKQAITIRYDSDIVDYFKAQGKGWQTAMNNALKDWIATHP